MTWNSGYIAVIYFLFSEQIQKNNLNMQQVGGNKREIQEVIRSKILVIIFSKHQRSFQ